ncbi:MAG: P1 family peptidase [Deltaproteobacteria bacterium]|nr:P1 family peptidase [Deltaproteobacteria bacterium]
MSLKQLRGGLTGIPGVRVGHARHAGGASGVTAVLFDAPVSGAAHLGGDAASTRQFGALEPAHVNGLIHAICFAGGSAYGLAAGRGVQEHLEEAGVGLPVSPGQRVPVVPTAILFDLPVAGAGVRPDAALGRAAAAAASAAPVKEGSVGAGAGASVGKCAGHALAMKGGVGSVLLQLPTGGRVGALAVVNAFGDVVDPARGSEIVAGVRRSERSRRFASTEKLLLGGLATRRYGGGNTTLCLVVTDQPLSRIGAARVARLASHGLSRTIRPAETAVDGDLCVVLTTAGKAGDGPEPEELSLGIAAAEAVSRAILRGVRKARGLPGLPGLADR